MPESHDAGRGDAPSRLEYAYTHERTEATTGYFSCEPPKDVPPADLLARLERTPWDDFLHHWCLRALCDGRLGDAADLAARAWDGDGRCANPALASLILEGALFSPALKAIADALPPEAAARIGREAGRATPSVHLRAAAREDAAAARAWSALAGSNIVEHHALPHPDEEDSLPPPLFPREDLQALRARMEEEAGFLPRFRREWIDARKAAGLESVPRWERPPAGETFLRAMDALMEADVPDGAEMRHEASLSPIALLRPWKVDISVRAGRHNHVLRGRATAYGRGLSLADARASCAMEIVERASAYVSVEENADGVAEVLERATPMPLIRASFADLRREGRAALDPDTLPLEAPAPDAPLHWLEARTPDGAAMLVPAQAVFLFCNLDEPSLFLAGGSTGLAAGNVMAEAKRAALTEIAERDADATTPFSRRGCFTLRSRDRLLNSLLEDYAARGMRIQFQEITAETGVPTFRCFVMGPRGAVFRATAANLDARRAVLSALTETPWPYPNGGPTGPALANLPERFLEDLPDLTLPGPEDDVRLLERVLTAQGRTPLYVDLTRKDFGIPVVRAIVPGLVLNADWDAWSRPSRRLLARILG